MIGKHLTSNHDFGRVNDKHSPSNGEDVEISTILKERNVSDELEGQQISFQRTDATLAWAKKKVMRKLFFLAFSYFVSTQNATWCTNECVLVNYRIVHM